MDEPLPPDVIERLHSDFGSEAGAIERQLVVHRQLGSEKYLGNRLIRCILFGAQGDASRIPHLIEVGLLDYRDMFLMAEYDAALRRLRDFNLPFSSAEIH